MKKVFIGLLAVVFLVGCNKEVNQPEEPTKPEPNPEEQIEFAGDLGGKLFTYGEFLHLDLNEFSFDNAFLVIGENEVPFVNGVDGFTLSDALDGGFFLPNLNVGEYDFYIKLDVDGAYKNYRLIDDFNFVFYPIKRDGYKEIKLENNKMIVTAIDQLPEDVYDIVLDPGHGGIDGGAVGRFDGKTYIEKEEVMPLSLELERLLKEAGYKVKLTRYDEEYPGNKRDMFADGGRVEIIHKASPKMLFSIHLNAHPQKRSGFEIYSTYRDGVIDEYIVNEMKKVAEASNNWYHRTDYMAGLYRRYLSSDDLVEWQEIIDAKDEEDQYEIFEILFDTERKVDYYIVIREVGGYATSAYEDGRRPEREPNEHRDSIYGIEGILVESAYIDDREDFFKFRENYKDYAKALFDAFDNYTKATH